MAAAAYEFSGGMEGAGGGGQPFLISDLASFVVDGMEREEGRKGGKPWV